MKLMGFMQIISLLHSIVEFDLYIMPTAHQLTRRNWTVLLVGLSRVSLRKLVLWAVSKTSFGSLAVVFW